MTCYVLELVDRDAFYRPCLSLACSHKAGGNHFFQKSPVMFPVYWQCQTKRHTVYIVHAAGSDPNYSGNGSTMCACVCVWYSMRMDICACHNEYVCTCQLLVPTSTYPVSCRCRTHVPSGPSQIAAYPPILPQSQSRTSRQQTGTLHLLEKPKARYHSGPCSQYRAVYHNVPQYSLDSSSHLLGGFIAKSNKFFFVSYFTMGTQNWN